MNAFLPIFCLLAEPHQYKYKWTTFVIYPPVSVHTGGDFMVFNDLFYFTRSAKKIMQERSQLKNVLN